MQQDHMNFLTPKIAFSTPLYSSSPILTYSTKKLMFLMPISPTDKRSSRLEASC